MPPAPKVHQRRFPLEVDGHDLERVFLKIVLGGAASGNLRGPGGTPLGAGLDVPVLRVLFGERDLPPSVGLFLMGQPNAPWLVERHIEVAAFADAEEPVAVMVNIAPLRFVLTLTPEGRHSPVLVGKSWFQPGAITVAGPNGINHRIVFKWKGGTNHPHVIVGYVTPSPAAKAGTASRASDTPG